MNTNVRIARRHLSRLMAEWPQAVVVPDADTWDPDSDWAYGGGFARQLDSGPNVVRVRIEGISGRGFNRRWKEILDELDETQMPERISAYGDESLNAKSTIEEIGERMLKTFLHYGDSASLPRAGFLIEKHRLAFFDGDGIITAAALWHNQKLIVPICAFSKDGGTIYVEAPSPNMHERVKKILGRILVFQSDVYTNKFGGMSVWSFRPAEE